MAAKTKEPATPGYTWKGAQVEFVSLKEGEMIEGVFLGVKQTQYGPAYKIKTADGIKTLSGNRAQLDTLLEDFLSTAPNNGKGVFIAVRRLENTKSKTGRTVGVYEMAIDPSKSVGFIS